eukprot:SAG25_NODE_87_length_16363_cov_40.489179_17_plen_109_part_00
MVGNLTHTPRTPPQILLTSWGSTARELLPAAMVAVRVSLSGWSGFGGSSSFGPSGSCLLLSLPSQASDHDLDRLRRKLTSSSKSSRPPSSLFEDASSLGWCLIYYYDY